MQLYFHCSDKNGYVDYPKARKLMEKLYEKGNISNEDYDLIKILISMSSQARFRGKIPIKEIKSAISMLPDKIHHIAVSYENFIHMAKNRYYQSFQKSEPDCIMQHQIFHHNTGKNQSEAYVASA